VKSSWGTLAGRVSARLEELLEGRARVLVAVSGGADSVFLARALAEYEWDLVIGHVDHGLRPESGADADFVRELARELDAGFRLARRDVPRARARLGGGIEEAARRVRYEALGRLARAAGASAIATGHHLGDQAETVLMQLLRGAARLVGMPERQGRVVRPMLGVEPDEVRAALRAAGHGWREDATNLNPTFTRNWVRTVLLPLVEERFPGARGRLAAIAATAREDADLARQVASAVIASGLPAHVDEFRSLAPAARRQALADLLAAAGVEVDQESVLAVNDLLDRRKPAARDLPGGKRARVAYGLLSVGGPEARQKIMQRSLPREVDPRKLRAFGPVEFRARRPGDRIRLAGGTRKLSDLLIDRKVPRERRDALRVLAAGTEVLWVEGIATDIRVARLVEDPASDWMREALKEARAAGRAGEVPVGAVVVAGGEIIGRGRNTTEADSDPAGHAEIAALRRASQATGTWRLKGAVLVVTLEPCPMCLGAAAQARVAEVIYGAPNPNEGAAGGATDLTRAAIPGMPRVRGGVLASACGRLLKSFFETRR
jgi:tRNA(Ile)-lysidine synthase